MSSRIDEIRATNRVEKTSKTKKKESDVQVFTPKTSSSTHNPADWDIAHYETIKKWGAKPYKWTGIVNTNDAIENTKLNNINNIEIVNGDAAEQFKKLINKDIKFDISVTDPPRKGCTPESIENLIQLTNKYIIYVSCNVSTLARDMKIINQKGFKTVYVQPCDLFPNTYHVETIALFEKVN